MKILCQDLRRVHIDNPHCPEEAFCPFMHMDEWSQGTLYRAEPVPGSIRSAYVRELRRDRTICHCSKRIHPSVKRLLYYRSCHILIWDSIMVNTFSYIKTKTLRYMALEAGYFHTSQSLCVISLTLCMIYVFIYKYYVLEISLIADEICICLTGNLS